MTVASAASGAGLAPALVRRIVKSVLAAEHRAGATVSVTFLSGPRMRALNRKAFGRDRVTDVIAFPLTHDGAVTGDVYVCPSAARRSAQAYDVTLREELIRLVVHGTLHVLGYDHPEGEKRTVSGMWRRQERYVRTLMGRT